MSTISVSGMTEDETALMCERYLEEEGIRRNSAVFDKHMFDTTDGLPLYIQHVCERFQESEKVEVMPEDIDLELDKMMESQEIEWFRNTEDRIRDYYSGLGKAKTAYCILDELSRIESLYLESDIIEYVNSQLEPESEREIIEVLDLLWIDHYLYRDVLPSGERCFRFTYKLMRKWWKVNRG